MMRKLKLPYNKNSKYSMYNICLHSYFNFWLLFLPLADPYLAADDFLNANELPSYYLDQV